MTTAMLAAMKPRGAQGQPKVERARRSSSTAIRSPKNISRRRDSQTLDPLAELKLDEYKRRRSRHQFLRTREALKRNRLDNKAVVNARTCSHWASVSGCLTVRRITHSNTSTEIRQEKSCRGPGQQAGHSGRAYNYAANTYQFANNYTSPRPRLPAKKGTYRSINGNVATAWGLCAAAEKAGLPLFCGSYPITPATVILEELAKRKDLRVKTAQAEDEIAGICTAIGAASRAISP